jgi:hypothetical protein
MSATHHPLPSEPPLECLKDLFKLIRSGTVSENMGDFLRHAYHVAGYALYLTVGDEKPLIGETKEEADAKEFGGLLAAEILATPTEQIEASPWPVIIPLVLQIMQLFVRK